MKVTYVPPPNEEIPVESQVAVSLTTLGITGGMDDEHRAARRLIADLAKVGVVIGDMREWRRDFLRGHVAGENEDHRLAGIIADQADEIDRLRAQLKGAETEPRVWLAGDTVPAGVLALGPNNYVIPANSRPYRAATALVEMDPLPPFGELVAQEKARRVVAEAAGEGKACQ